MGGKSKAARIKCQEDEFSAERQGLAGNAGNKKCPPPIRANGHDNCN
jgi:hypothetical protein